MSDTAINANTSITDRYALPEQKRTANKEMGKNQFLELMVAQLKHQDPLNPVQNEAFVAQLAQFSSLEGIQNLNKSMDTVATTMASNQALQASLLVGRSVHVENQTAAFSGDKAVQGLANLPASTDQLRVTVLDKSGQIVRQMDLGAQSAGEVKFGWDGRNNQGQVQMPGVYELRVEALQDGKNTRLTTWLPANVDSVTLDPVAGMQLNLAGIGARTLTAVKQINQ